MCILQASAMDPHNRRPPGSGSAWTDPDTGGEKLGNKTENCRYIKSERKKQEKIG